MALYNVDRPNINAVAAGLAKDTDRLLERIQEYKSWLDTLTDNQLITTYGYVQGDIDVLRSAVGDLDQLRSIYQGLANLTNAKDFRTFAKLLYPFGSIV